MHKINIPRSMKLLIFSILIAFNLVYCCLEITSLKYKKNIDYIYTIHLVLHKDIDVLHESIKVKNILVTRGANGAIYYNVSKNIFYETPAYASKIIDKVGAGDTLLAIFSICFYNKIPADLSLFIASLAASSVVESMGNSMKIDKVSLLKSIQYFLK